MKILHIAMASHFTEGMLYQENYLLDIHAAQGNDVTIITDIWHFEGSKLVAGSEEDRVLDNGVRLVRLAYDSVLTGPVTEKIQKCRKLKKYIEDIGPDTILYHGVCGYELMDTADYIKAHPGVLFFVDSHEDFTNSAMTPVSKAFYKIIHGRFVKKAKPYVTRFLSISKESNEWLEAIYGLKESEIDFFALGGTMYTDEQQQTARQAIVNKYALPQDAVILAHSGKLAAAKRSADLLTAFTKVRDPRLALFVFGSIPEDQEDIIRPLMESDSRIHFMGWKVSKEIEEFLAGVDIYCQPGSQSSTFETALCAGCVNMTWPHPTYQDVTYTDCGGDNYFYVDTIEDMVDTFQQVLDHPEELARKKKLSYAFADKVFNYENIAKRVYHK